MMKPLPLASGWLEFCRVSSIAGVTILDSSVAYQWRHDLGDDDQLRQPVSHLSPILFLAGLLHDAGWLEGGGPLEERCKMMISS